MTAHRLIPVRKVLSLADRLCQQRGDQQVSPGDLIAALIHVAGRHAEPMLARMNIDAARVQRSIADRIEPGDAAGNDEVSITASPDLTTLLAGPLAPLANGKASPEWALSKLMLDVSNMHCARQYLQSLAELQESTATSQMPPTRLLREACGIYARSLGLSRRFYDAPVNEYGMTAFALGRSDKEFNDEVGRFYDAESLARSRWYQDRTYLDSPFGQVLDEHGEHSSTVLLVTALIELRLLDPGVPLIPTVVAWAADPGHYARCLVQTLQCVRKLFDDGYLQMDDAGLESIRPMDRVRLSDQTFQDVCAWIDQQPLTSDEVQAMSRRLLPARRESRG